MPSFQFQTVWFAILVTVGMVSAVGQSPDRPQKPSPRAARPDWSQVDTRDIFFEDAVRDGLSGPRPAHWAAANRSAATRSQPVADAGGGKKFAWSRLISAETLEDVVKSQQIELRQSIVQPAQFASGGHRTARQQFVMLATLFAIIQEFDGDVRWKRDAESAKQRCQQAAQVSKVGSLSAFQAARGVRDELADLMRGESLPARPPAETGDWSLIADRGVLMQVLETQLEKVLQPVTSRDESFSSQSAELARSAQLVAAIAEVLTREGMDDAGDEDYDVYCRRIQTAVEQLMRAIESRNAPASRQAVGEVAVSCSGCHESYR